MVEGYGGDDYVHNSQAARDSKEQQRHVDSGDAAVGKELSDVAKEEKMSPNLLERNLWVARSLMAN